MKLKNLEIRSDKNKMPYVYVSYLDKNNKERNICLNHYDIEYSVKGKIKYEKEHSKK